MGWVLYGAQVSELSVHLVEPSTSLLSMAVRDVFTLPETYSIRVPWGNYHLHLSGLPQMNLKSLLVNGFEYGLELRGQVLISQA